MRELEEIFHKLNEREKYILVSYFEHEWNNLGNITKYRRNRKITDSSEIKKIANLTGLSHKEIKEYLNSIKEKIRG